MDYVKKIYDRLASSGFLKSVFTLSSGVLIGQIINFVGMPFVGRMYTPAEMGDYELIVANASIISAVACLGMMTSFMLPKEDEESRGLCHLVTGSTVLITTVVIVTLYLMSGSYRIFHTDEISYGSALAVLWTYIVFDMVRNICYAYVNRKKMYRVMFWNPVISAGVNVAAGIGFGMMGWGFVGYTAAHILSFVINIVHLLLHANPYQKIENPENKGLALLKRYSRFPLYQMPANLISTLSRQLPVKIIESIYSSYELGLYSMAMKILSLPVSLLATPINRVFFQEASARYSRGENIGAFCYKILATNIKLAIIPIVALIILGEPVFALFLGEQWREAGHYAAILGVYQMMQFCASCLSGHFVIIKKSKWNLISAIVSLTMCVLLYEVCNTLKSVTIIQYLTALSLLMTLKIIADQSALFLHLKFALKQYLLLILRWVFIPCALAFLISTAIWR